MMRRRGGGWKSCVTIVCAFTWAVLCTSITPQGNGTHRFETTVGPSGGPRSWMNFSNSAGTQCQVELFTAIDTDEYGGFPRSVGMEEMACASSWVTHLQEFKSSQSIKAFRAGRLVRTVETSVFVTFEGIGAGRHYTESSDGIPRFSFYHPPSVSTSREVSVTKTYWNPISTPPIDWCLKDRRQPACHLRVGGISCDKFYMKYLRELFDGIQIGNRHNTALNMNPEVCTGASPYGEAVCNVVAGNEVVLIFWPSPVSSMDVCRTDDGGCRLTTHNSHNQSRVLITTAITFKGQDLYFRSEIINGTTRIAKEDWVKPSVMTGLWTFTSPTIYLAHQAISNVHTTFSPRSNKHGNFLSSFTVWSETTIFNTGGVLALRDGDIFTVQPVRHDSAQLEGLRYAQDIARGDYNPDLPFFDILETRKLDLKHLVDPIPASIYYNARSAECWGKQSHCGTLTDGRFRPQLSLRGAVWSSLNSWDGGYYCSYPLLLDPPIRLEPISESKIQIIHPVISATPAGEYGTPYDEGVSWLSNPSPQLLPGQDYHAQSRPPLSLPTPLPTPSRRPFEGPRGGNLQPIKPFAEEGAIADEGRDKGNTGYHKSPVAEDESSKNDKGSFEKGGKKGEKMGDKKVDKKGDDKSDKKTDRKGDKKGGEKDEKKDHREDWNKGDTKDDAYGNEDGDQKNDSQKDRAASGEDDMVEAKTSRPQKSPDRSSTRSKSTAASLRGGLSQYVPVVATAVCGFLVAFVVS